MFRRTIRILWIELFGDQAHVWTVPESQHQFSSRLKDCQYISDAVLNFEGCQLTSQSYSEGIGMIRPRASSNLTGACAHVWRISGSGSLCNTVESFSIISLCDFLLQLERHAAAAVLWCTHTKPGLQQLGENRASESYLCRVLCSTPIPYE